jgi:hypothetical protein
LSTLPGPVEKRDILFGVKKPTQAALIEMGKKFEAQDWLSDALDFYHQASDRDSISTLQKKAALEGQFFLLSKACRYLGQDAQVARDLFFQCAEKAEANGMIRYAIKAWEAIGLEDRATPLREKIAADGDQVAEAESSVFIPENEEPIEEDS